MYDDYKGLCVCVCVWGGGAEISGAQRGRREGSFQIIAFIALIYGVVISSDLPFDLFQPDRCY